MFAYHLKSPDFVGDSILPLNEIEKYYPTLAEKYKRKYIGRKSRPDKNLVFDPKTFEPMNIHMGSNKLYWGDDSFYSLVDIDLIFMSLKKMGLVNDNLKKEYFKIPIDTFYENSLVWKYEQEIIDNKLNPRDCLTAKDAIKTLNVSKIPEKTIEYYENALLEKQIDKTSKFLLFPYIPHLMTTNEINISKLKPLKIT